MTVTRWCGGCAAESAFERFDCTDHGGDCVECVCVRCGSGIELETRREVVLVTAPRQVSAA